MFSELTSSFLTDEKTKELWIMFVFSLQTMQSSFFYENVYWCLPPCLHQNPFTT